MEKIMIDKERLLKLSDEQLNYLIKEFIEEIKKLQTDNKQKQDYLNQLLNEIDN